MGKCQVIFCLFGNNIYMRNKIRRELIKARLKEELENCGMKYTDIAKEVGINVALLSQYRTTNKLPALETLARICEVIGADSNYNLGLTDYQI